MRRRLTVIQSRGSKPLRRPNDPKSAAPPPSRPVRVAQQRDQMRQAQERADETGRVILMHNGAQWNAGGGGQRPQQIAEELASEAAVVHICSWNVPTIYPPEHPIIANTVNLSEWLSLRANSRVLYTAYPDQHLWSWLGEVGHDWQVWYDCVDHWAHFQNNWFNPVREEILVKRSDLLTATAHYLCNHIASMNRTAHFLPNSTRLLLQPEPPPTDPEFDCVFVGCMAEDWFNWELLEALAQAGHSIRLIGARPGKVRLKAGNVDWRGQVPNTELRAELTCGRVGIVPFRDMPLVHAVWPIKYADYLAAGIPTVAAHMPELDGAAFCSVAHSDADFIAAVEEALATDWPREEIMAEAEQHTARARVEELRPWLKEVSGW